MIPPTRAFDRTQFGVMPDGTDVELYTLRNRRGMEARIATYGGTVTSFTAPDRAGHCADVVLGYDTLAGYLKSDTYFGALIGRFANRIAKGKFILDGITHALAINDAPNSLHGGKVGFDKVVWKVADVQITPRGPQLVLTHLSRDGEDCYPGNLTVTAVYTLTQDDCLCLEYTATTDKNTVVNFSQHSYFNLRGRDDILGHVVQIHADRFTPVDSSQIPTGELRSVSGTPFDFRAPTAIGARIGSADEQLTFAKGYDHNWVLNRPEPVMSRANAVNQTAETSLNATVYEPESGRLLEVWSDQPGLQFYTGNSLDGSIGKRGQVYHARDALCMEPQHFPDSPNHPDFPSTELKPGQIYHCTIIYRLKAH